MTVLALCCFCAVLYALISPAETLAVTPSDETVQNDEQTDETVKNDKQTDETAPNDEQTDETAQNDDNAQKSPTESSAADDTIIWETPAADADLSIDETEEMPDDGTNVVAHVFSGKVRMQQRVMARNTDSSLGVENTSAISIYYKDTSSGRWFEITDETTDIPANVQLRINISYNNIPIKSLIDAGGIITYQLPKTLTEARANGIISGADKSSVGTISANGGREVTLTYDVAWLQVSLTAGQTHLQGDFNTYAKFNWEESPDGGDVELVFGDVTKTVHLENDISAKYGTVLLEKACGGKILYDEEGQYYYLKYTLKIEAPSDQSITLPSVSIQDRFTENADYIEGYIFPEETETKTTDGVTVITIGDMSPGDSSTLTYRVRLKNSYVGDRSQGDLTNQATAYSKGYEKANDEVSYTPSAELKTTKTAGEYDQTNGTISYTITVTAPQTNSYPMQNVLVKDFFDEQFAEYVTYQQDTMKLDGGTITTDCVSIDNTGGSSVISIGELKAGETKTLTYTVKTSPAILATDNHTVTLRNTAEIYTGENLTPKGERYANAICEKELQKKVWNRKTVDTATEQEQIISMDTGTVYSSENGSITETSGVSSFEVPVGSYRYQVIVNEAADWNMTEADFTDELENNFLNFFGYVKVESFSADKVANKGLSADSSDGVALRILSSLTPDHVSWLAISSTNFSFQPSQLGITGNCAYLLTYYAAPNTEALKDTNQTSVTNHFSVSGNAYQPGYGPGNGMAVELPNVQASAPVVVQGGTQYTVNKQGWYYNLKEWTYGKLYWVVEVKGDIVQGMSLIDEPATWWYEGSSTNNRLWDNAIYGVYKGSLKGKTFNGKEITSLTDCNSVNDLSQLGLQLLPQTSYSWTRSSEYCGTLTFNESYHLQMDESIYVILMTEPHMWYSPSVTSYDFFLNKISSQSPGGSKVEHNTASLAVSGHDSLFKESVGVTEYNAASKTWTQISGKRGASHLATNRITESGTYVEWIVHVNWRAVLAGEAEITENLPDGMNLQYVRIIGAAEHYLTGDNMPGTNTMPELEASEDWVSDTVTTDSVYKINRWEDWQGNQPLDYQKTASCTYYYNASLNQAKWTVNNLYMIPVTDTDVNKYYCKGTVDFQVVCRITDPDILLGGSTKTFTNAASLNGSNATTDSHQADIEIKKTTLTKSVLQAESTSDGTLNFTIDANPLGEDLVANNERITLVDSMETPLTLDTSTLKVYEKVGDSKTELSSSEWSVKITDTSSGGQLIEIDLPDSKHLVVEYNAILNAAPGSSVSITNKAYWKGYPSQSGSSITKDNFLYESTGSAGTTGSPKLQLTKADKENASHYLAGAEFCVKELVTEDGTLQPSDTAVLTGTTDDSGQIGVDAWTSVDGGQLQENVIYCIQETKAPDGYVLDSTLYYFAVANTTSADSYAAFQAQLKTAQTQGLTVSVWYGGLTYRITIYNSKGTLKVDKVFWDSINNQEMATPPDGTYRFGLYENMGGTGNYVSLLEIVWKLGQVSYRLDGQTVDAPAFTNLTAGKIYYIYELDEQDDIIAPGEVAQINGKMYGVTYKVGTTSGNSASVDADSNAKDIPVFSVQNTSVAQYVLPNTGGGGTGTVTRLGIFLISAAVSVYCLRILKKKRKGGNGTPI